VGEKELGQEKVDRFWGMSSSWGHGQGRQGRRKKGGEKEKGQEKLIAESRKRTERPQQGRNEDKIVI